MFGLGFFEIIVVLVVALLVVGPERLPELARTLGRFSWQLRKAADEFRSEVQLSSIGIDDELRKDLNEIRRLRWDAPDALGIRGAAERLGGTCEQADSASESVLPSPGPEREENAATEVTEALPEKPKEL
ncbi:MAG: twin-arginine translocase subunit TatB [Bdellovibrionales bacterium]|nr:twin-arginine translocase subunit TatB [Bdellovibrionales bacterium]